MIRDFLTSADLLHPYRFAVTNYAQYPAFSMPFHPPAYPGMMALVFLVTGTSYIAARAFVAACLALCACGIYAIQRRFGVGRGAAFASGLILLTTPEVARWGRDTMSEVPSLAVFLLASYLFLAWLDSGRPLLCWAAFGAAAVAFLCRIPIAGLMPGWFLFSLGTARGHRLKSPHVIAASLLYLALAGGYVLFASRYSRFETAADGHSKGISWASLSYFTDCFPRMATWGSTVVGLVALVGFAAFGRRSMVGRFWLSWLLSYTAFKLFMPTTAETRHFFAALPALAGLTACLFEPAPRPLARAVGSVVVAIGLILNASHLAVLPRGVVGYEEVGESLAAQDRPGNVLLACPYDQELMFRYRAFVPGSRRIFVRGDRVLAIRLPDYARVPARLLTFGPDDVVDVLKRGRIRYLVTVDVQGPAQDNRTEEMILADRTATARPKDFALIARHPLLVQFGAPCLGYRVSIWAYLGELPDGPSQLPVVIPTADLSLPPPG